VSWTFTKAPNSVGRWSFPRRRICADGSKRLTSLSAPVVTPCTMRPRVWRTTCCTRGSIVASRVRARRACPCAAAGNRRSCRRAAPRDLALNRHAHHPFEHRAEEVALQELPQADEGLAVGHRAAAQAAEVPVRDAAAYLPLELLVAPGLEMLEHQQP